MVSEMVLTFLLSISLSVQNATDSEWYSNWTNINSIYSVDGLDSLVCTASNGNNYIIEFETRFNAKLYFNDSHYPTTINDYWDVRQPTLYFAGTIYQITSNNKTNIDSFALTLNQNVPNFNGFSSNTPPNWANWTISVGTGNTNDFYMNLWDQDDDLLIERYVNINNVSFTQYSRTTVSIDYQYIYNQCDTFVQKYWETIEKGEANSEHDYQSGYSDGYKNALEQGSTAATIFSGIVTVGLLPVNFFLGILNFEIFGINIGAFVSALLTVAIIVIVVKMITGNGGGKSD